MSTPDFFRSRLDAMIDLRHPLAVLANRMPWTSIEATLTPIFEGRAREGRVSDEGLCRSKVSGSSSGDMRRITYETSE